MSLLLALLTILFSILSTAILSYISMAVMIGPWINSVIVIACSMILLLVKPSMSHAKRVPSIALVTAGSSLGGILATGCGFTFPTLYFLNQPLFTAWLASPLYFMGIMAAISFCAGALGLFIADFFEKKLINEAQLPFPVGEVSYKLAAVQEKGSQMYQLVTGMVSSILYTTITWYYAVARSLVIVQERMIGIIKVPALGIRIEEFPLLVSIGYIAGSIIMVPLIIGVGAKIFIMNPAYDYFFTYLPYNDFSFAFIGGMVLYGALMSLLEIPKVATSMLKKIRKDHHEVSEKLIDHATILLGGVLIASTSFILWWFGFSWILQLYLMLFTALCTYQLLIIGGELGLAPVGRYATFVMLPAMLIFGLRDLHIMMLSLFVEVCGGVAVDVLFGRKLTQLSEIPSNKVRKFQWLGLVVSSLTVGIFFWILIKKFDLGVPPLIAQRSQMRALQTAQFGHFDFYAMTLGALFGTMLKDFKINPIMVLGGILMPLDSVFALIIGGAGASALKDSKKYDLFWSGIFATASISMILKAFLG